MRDQITLACNDCKRRNYIKTKNKRLHPDRAEMKKYCPSCRKHTDHKETREEGGFVSRPRRSRAFQGRRT